MSFFMRASLKGLLVVLPFLITAYLVSWFIWGTESLIRRLFRDGFGLEFYFPGLGILLALGALVLIGTLMSTYIAQAAYRGLQKIIGQLPVLKTIFFAVEDFLKFFASSKTPSKSSRVVLVEKPGGEIRCIGIIMNDELGKFGKEQRETEVAVYIPMSFQIGGTTIFVPKKWTTEVDMSVEQAMKMAMTGWVGR